MLLMKIHLYFKPLYIQSDSIIHPATKDKTAGQIWPIFENDQMHLRKVLPALVRTNHAIAFYDDDRHNNRDALGRRIFDEITDLVSMKMHIQGTYQYFQLKYQTKFYEDEVKKAKGEAEAEAAESNLESQLDENRNIVDEVQAVAKHWLYNMKYMIIQLRINPEINTTGFNCKNCDYKCFR